MDIACGVLDLQDAAACQAAEAAAASGPSLDELTATAANEKARISQQGMALPGGAVLSPPAGPRSETSCSEDEGAGHVLTEVSTRRGDSTICSEQDVPESSKALETALPGSDADPTDGCSVLKKQRIEML